MAVVAISSRRLPSSAVFRCFPPPSRGFDQRRRRRRASRARHSIAPSIPIPGWLSTTRSEEGADRSEAEARKRGCAAEGETEGRRDRETERYSPPPSLPPPLCPSVPPSLPLFRIFPFVPYSL